MVIVKCGKSESTSHYSTASQDPVYQLSVEDFLKEFNSNQIAADLKYKGRTIALWGEISSFGRTAWNDFPTIDLVEEDFTFDVSGHVECAFPKSAEASIARLSKRMSITVKGKVVGGSSLFPRMEDCSLQSGP